MNGVSVIIPAWNAEQYLARTLDSVLGQSWRELEVIVVDDASQDATARIAQQYAQQDSRVHYYRNECNSGVAYTRNFAISRAQYDWVAFLDSDDLWREDKLERQMALVEKYPDTALCYTASRYFTDADPETGTVVLVPEEVELERLLRKNVIPCSSVMVKKSLMESAPMGHDDAHEDYLTWLTLLKAGHKARGVNEPMLLYRLRADSKSGAKQKAAKMTWRTFRYFGLGRLESVKYMCWYCLESLGKYRKILSGQNQKET